MDFSQIPIISITQENIDAEHICCAMSDKKSAHGVKKKKDLMKTLFDRGYTFRKLDERGKVFIEYMPAEIALRPVIAPGYWFIQCLWVSGKFKGHGLSTRLLDHCMDDAKESNGVVVVTSAKPFLNDKKFFLHHGFAEVDAAPPHFELLVKKFKEAPDPAFTDSARENMSKNHDGVYIEISDQCPFTDYYVQLLEGIADQHGISFQVVKLSSPEALQQANSAYGTFSLFYKGEFKTHVIPAEKQFSKILELS